MPSIETLLKRVEKLEAGTETDNTIVYLDDEGNPIGEVPDAKHVIYLCARDLDLL